MIMSLFSHSQKQTPKIETSECEDISTKSNIHNTMRHPVQLYKHPHKACLIFIFYYFSIYIFRGGLFSAASLFSFLPLIYFLLHLPYSSFSFLSHLLSEMLSAEGWALGATFTKAPHTHTNTTHIHIKTLRASNRSTVTDVHYYSDFMSLKKNYQCSIN